MLCTKLGIDDVERLLAPLETLFDKRKQHSVFFVGAVEEGADVTSRAKRRAREPNRLAAFTRSSPAGVRTVIGGIHRSSPSDRRSPHPTTHWHRGNRRQSWPAPARQDTSNGHRNPYPPVRRSRVPPVTERAACEPRQGV